MSKSAHDRKVKVCHFSSAHRWFDERIYQKECRSLARAGYEVVFLVPCDTCVCTETVRVVTMPKTSSRLERFTVGLATVLKLAIRERADVYHFHDPDLILAGTVLKTLGRKVIYDVHEDYEQSILSNERITPPLRRLLARLFRGVEMLLSRLFDAIIVVDSNIQSKFPSHKTERITNVPPLRFFDEARGVNQRGPFRLVFLGSISENHGITQMLKAPQLAYHADRFELHLIGSLGASGLAMLWASNPRVLHHGRIPWEQTLRMLTTADVGLLLYQPSPAHLHFTGEGNTKLFEYMGSGLPVVYSDFPKLRALLDPIGCGIAVDPTDPDAIAAVFDYLYENPALRLQMAEAGRRAVRERYNWEAEECKLLAVYARVLGIGSPSDPRP